MTQIDLLLFLLYTGMKNTHNLTFLHRAHMDREGQTSCTLKIVACSQRTRRYILCHPNPWRKIMFLHELLLYNSREFYIVVILLRLLETCYYYCAPTVFYPLCWALQIYSYKILVGYTDWPPLHYIAGKTKPSVTYIYRSNKELEVRSKSCLCLYASYHVPPFNKW